MAIGRPTLRILRQLMLAIGKETDATTRALTQSWVRAWDELSAQWVAAMRDAGDQFARTGQWPSAWDLGRIERLGQAMQASEQALIQLATRAGVSISDGAETIARADADVEPRLVSSQLPAAEQAAAAARFTGNVVPAALDVIVARSQSQIVSSIRPLAAAAMDAMRRELVRGVAVGDNPNQVAGRMVARVEGAFNGGLSRAINVARTEMLDTYRTVSRYQHAANADLVSGWIWISSLDKRTCPSCWSMHGSVHPVEQPGPLDHQQGRCARAPKTRSWRELGINVDEPEDDIPNAQAKFWALSPDDQTAIMGPGRLGLLKTGRIGWDDLPAQRASAGWRTSYAPRTVGDLQRLADRRAAAGVTPTPPAGVAPPPVPKWHRALDTDQTAMARTLQTAETSTRPLGGGVWGDTRLVTHQDGTSLVRKEYGRKAEHARTGGIKAQADAEQLASLVVRAAGGRAPTVLRTGDGTVYMRHAPGRVGGDIVQWGEDVPAHIVDSDEGRLLGLADALMVNCDRNTGNWLMDGRALVGIDHGFAFEATIERAFAGDRIGLDLMRGNPFAAHFVGEKGWAASNDMSPADMAAIRARLLALLPDFEHVGRLSWWNSMMKRMAKLESAASGTRSRLP